MSDLCELSPFGVDLVSHLRLDRRFFLASLRQFAKVGSLTRDHCNSPNPNALVLRATSPLRETFAKTRHPEPAEGSGAARNVRRVASKSGEGDIQCIRFLTRITAGIDTRRPTHPQILRQAQDDKRLASSAPQFMRPCRSTPLLGEYDRTLGKVVSEGRGPRQAQARWPRSCKLQALFVWTAI